MAKRRGRGAIPEDPYLRTRPTLLPGNPVGSPFGGVSGPGGLGGDQIDPSPYAPRAKRSGRSNPVPPAPRPTSSSRRAPSSSSPTPTDTGHFTPYKPTKGGSTLPPPKKRRK